MKILEIAYNVVTITRGRNERIEKHHLPKELNEQVKTLKQIEDIVSKTEGLVV